MEPRSNDEAATGSNQPASTLPESLKADEMETSECEEMVRPAQLAAHRPFTDELS